MTSFLKLQAIAAARGDGLHPKLLAMFESMASAPQSGLMPRVDGMIQSGPNPLAEKFCGESASVSILPLRIKQKASNDAT